MGYAVKEAEGVAEETEGAGGRLHDCSQGHKTQQQRLTSVGCRWTGRQTQAEGEGPVGRMENGIY